VEGLGRDRTTFGADEGFYWTHGALRVGWFHLAWYRDRGWLLCHVVLPLVAEEPLPNLFELVGSS